MDLLIVGSAALILGLFAGYLWGHSAGSAPWREQERAREIERRLTGPSMPRHRSTAPPAVVRAARLASSKAWRK